MINCSQCKEAISDEAKVCPKCGHPQFVNGVIMSTIFTIIVISVLSFGLAFLFPSLNTMLMGGIVGIAGIVYYSFISKVRK